MNSNHEFYSAEQIKCARERVKMIYENFSEKMEFAVIEEKLHTNYHTFRAWYSGGTDYFNNKISLLADLFGISVDYLIGNTDNPYVK